MDFVSTKSGPPLGNTPLDYARVNHNRVVALGKRVSPMSRPMSHRASPMNSKNEKSATIQMEPLEHSRNWTITKSGSGRRDKSNVWRWTDTTQTVAEFAIDPEGKGLPSMFVDACDLENILRLTWGIQRAPFGETYYASTRVPKPLLDVEPFSTMCQRPMKQPRRFFMHMLLNPNWCMTDHINGNGLDNRRENLIATDKQQNALNCRVNKANKSGATGVFLTKTKGESSWVAYYKFNKKRTSKIFSFGIHSHRSKEEAFELAVAWRKEKDKETGCRNGMRPKAV